MGYHPKRRYLFKHALIQDTAYQSLLKSRASSYHQQIAQVLEERFPETVETQPELLAHHYTEAGLTAQAIPHWQRAGERATQRSAYVEAIAHLTKGLELLKTLPDTPERAQQELTLQLALGDALVAQGLYGPRSGKNLYPGPGTVPADGGDSPALPRAVGLCRFYLSGRSSRQPVSWRSSAGSGPELQDPSLLSLAHTCTGDHIVLILES